VKSFFRFLLDFCRNPLGSRLTLPLRCRGFPDRLLILSPKTDFVNGYFSVFCPGPFPPTKSCFLLCFFRLYFIIMSAATRLDEGFYLPPRASAWTAAADRSFLLYKNSRPFPAFAAVRSNREGGILETMN